MTQDNYESPYFETAVLEAMNVIAASLDDLVGNDDNISWEDQI